jgi:hypothetical protein
MLEVARLRPEPDVMKNKTAPYQAKDSLRFCIGAGS